jgi:hypothetical protein
MPIDPLQTDERLASKPAKEKDFEIQLMTGCGGFVTASILGFVLFAWPFFATQDVHHLDDLLKACALGMAPSTILTAFIARKFGLAGASGAFAAAMASSIFLLLRLEQVDLAGQARDSLRPDYPPMFGYMIAIAWMIWTAIVGLLCMKKGELPTPEE